eukprot:4747491-Prymnesium_polylepis.1
MSTSDIDETMTSPCGMRISAPCTDPPSRGIVFFCARPGPGRSAPRRLRAVPQRLRPARRGAGHKER